MEQQSSTSKYQPLYSAIAFVLLALGSTFVLWPFIGAVMWAVIIAFALEPIHALFVSRFRIPRTLAALMVSVIVILLIAVPVTFVGMRLAQESKDLTHAARNWILSAPKTTPKMISNLPIIGNQCSKYWESAISDRDYWMKQLDQSMGKIAPKAREVLEVNGELKALPTDEEKSEARTSQIIGMIGSGLNSLKGALFNVGKMVGNFVMQLIISVMIAFFLLKHSQVLGERTRRLLNKISPKRGEEMLLLAGGTVRGVIYGILGTALAQGCVATIGFAVAGVPGAILLGILTLFLSMVPVGPPLVWIPVTVWLFSEHQVWWGIFMIVWGALVISGVDNIIKPLIISQGSKMPFILVLCGVLGGALAFGLVGVFIGPILLALIYSLLIEWTNEK